MSTDEPRVSRNHTSWYAVGGLVLGAILGGVVVSWISGQMPFLSGANRAADVPAELVIAHITDPLVSDTSDSRVLVGALRALRGQPGAPSPGLIVISGELISPGVRTATPAATANRATLGAPTQTVPESSKPAATAVAALGSALAQSPTIEVFLFGDNTFSESLASILARTDSAGVHIHDLAPCIGPIGTSVVECNAGDRYLLIPVPELPKDETRARAIIAEADSLVARAGREGKRVILIPWNLPGTDTESQRIAAAWVNVTSRDVVAAVLTRSGDGVAAPTSKFVRSPPLGGSGTAGTRGLSVVTLREGMPHSEVLLYNESFRRVVAATAPEARERLPILRYYYGVAESLSEPVRSTILWIAILAAFLTVAALWKVPDTIVETSMTVAAAGAAAAFPTGAPGTQPQSAAVTTTVSAGDDTGNVLQSNLGRTVLSGLTGIVAVAVLKEVWGISGTTGQALYALAFIVAFLTILVFSAFSRAVIEAFRDRVSANRRTVELTGVRNPRWQKFAFWFGSYRTTILVFLDTFTSVLFGHAPLHSLVWANRYTELQEALLASVDGVREQLSDAVGEALKRTRVEAYADRDYRVNVSLLAADGTGSYYISAARGSFPHVFGQKSIAYVAIRGGEARWWKISYEGGHTHVRSTARLRGRNGVALAVSTKLTDIAVLSAAGFSTQVLVGELEVEGMRGDSSPVLRQKATAETVGDLLSLLNGDVGFGGGLRPSGASIDADGRVVLADSEKGPSDLAVSTLSLGGQTLDQFVPCTADDIVLFHNVPEVFSGAGTDLLLKDYFQQRGVLDYEAFIVIPVPFARRGLTRGGRRAGIHISFSRATSFNALWSGLERAPRPPANQILPNYDANGQVLGLPMLMDEVLRAVLAESVRVLGELIQPINDTWYWSRGVR
jgi:hypothetical protein